MWAQNATGVLSPNVGGISEIICCRILSVYVRVSKNHGPQCKAKNIRAFINSGHPFEKDPQIWKQSYGSLGPGPDYGRPRSVPFLCRLKPFLHSEIVRTLCVQSGSFLT